MSLTARRDGSHLAHPRDRFFACPFFPSCVILLCLCGRLCSKVEVVCVTIRRQETMCLSYTGGILEDRGPH